MSIHLADFEDALVDLDDPGRSVVEANWHEAARVFTPRGLEAYIKGAVSLKALGRNCDLAASFLENAPAVAREIGEQAVTELLATASRMYSKTSLSVVNLLIATAPTAAARLGEFHLFADYLALLDNLGAQAPRALRPLLENLERLLAQLTLGGLRRWAMRGVAAYRTNYTAQAEYFGLESAESLAVLQAERRGVLFVDVQRRLIMYLRALWARDFFLRPTSGDFETRTGYQPFIDQHVINLPDAVDDHAAAGGKVDGLEVYRAQVAHCAAHLAYSRPFAGADAWDALQKAAIEVVEDARVEQLAVARFPGLKTLWGALETDDAAAADVAGTLVRIRRALRDPRYGDDDPHVAWIRGIWQENQGRIDSPDMARDIGFALAERLRALPGAQARIVVPEGPYRDDNRHLWVSPETEHLLMPRPQGQVRKYVSIMEMVNAIDVETAGDDAEEIWVLPTELYDDDGTTYNAREGKEPVSMPVHYHEWDYLTQLERPHWVTLVEKRPRMGDPARIDAVLETHKPLVRRLKFLIEALQPQGIVRIRKQEDGDEIDLNAAVAATIDMRMKVAPDWRVGIRVQRKVRDLSVMLLLDLSESTNDAVRGAGQSSVLDLSREAAALLADAMAKIGDPFAIHGFDSNGRHDVEYYRFKDFDQPYDEKVRGRLSGMTGQLSTRMGAALRHAGSLLARRPSHKKLLLVLTDGEPADNDERDPQYLRYDAKKAVEEVARQGIHTYCLSLDPYADQYVARIFGQQNYLVLDHVARLPEKLPFLYAGLTR